MTDPTPPIDAEFVGDPVVTRVNELMTTALDFAVTVLFAIAAWVATTPLPRGISWLAAGATLLFFSVVAQWRNRPRKSRPTETAPANELPGAEHPGNLHVLGR